MNAIKEQIRKENAKELSRAGIKWESLNNDLHWKIGNIDFYPTTSVWNCNATEEGGCCVEDLIDYLKKIKQKSGIKRLSTEQMFEIAKRVKPMNLNSVCVALHKEIYGN